MNKLLGYLALSRKAGKLALGEEQLAAAIHSSRARLVVFASDCAESSRARIARMAQGRAPMLTLPATREQLGAAVGRPVCAAAAVTDANLALALAQSLPDADEQTLAELSRRVRRAAKKRK